MIDRQEVMDLAREFSLAPNVVEKDYALGWLLAGIYAHPRLKDAWVFKGGTCLKKCYFETYRFSEDLDFTLTDESHLDEILVLEPAQREVTHPYSDQPGDGIHAQCYAFEEVFAEKVRALAERERPRDLYDVVHLHRHEELHPDRKLIFSTLQRKCEFKGIPVPTFEALAHSPRRAELEAEWGNMLEHQLPVLPDFPDFWTALPEVLGWLHGTMEKTARTSLAISRADIDETWQPSAMGRSWNAQVPLETIRFAAANRLCIVLSYRHKDRQVEDYLLEPYSLRRTQDGNLLLYAIKHETGDIRAFRIDHMLDVKTTKITFVPRYRIELTPVSEISTGTKRPGASISRNGT